MNEYEELFLFLNLPNDGMIKIDKVEEMNNVKYVHISRIAQNTYCDICGCKMHSKGIYTRKVNHQILQDNTKLYLIVHQRKWRCTNPACNQYMNESFPFLIPYSHSSTLVPLLVLEAMKDLNRTTASIARQFNLSDTQVHDIFTAYVDLSRLELPEIISIDEVFIDISEKEKYALVIMDFKTGEIIDILHNRWEKTTAQYFYKIPLEERKKVKYIISDAYNSYMDYPKKYFPNASSILDSFHVSKQLISKLNEYVNKVLKRYKEKDEKKLKEKNDKNNLDNKTIKDSQEVILLRSYRWVLLKNRDEINYSTKKHYHHLLGMNVDTATIEKKFLELDPSFKKLRNLKEMYIDFNHTFFETYEETAIEFDKLIAIFEASDQYIFRDFADTLKKYYKEILASLTVVEVKRRTQDEQTKYYSRLSNGPMESFNRKPKDYKRNARGFSNFDYTRNRILWATRSCVSIRGIPKTRKQIHKYEGKPRGKYNKQ